MEPSETFEAFPPSRVQGIETRQKAREPYESPHHPQAKQRAAAAGMVMNGVPTAGVAAEHMPGPGRPTPVQTPQPDQVPVEPLGFSGPATEHEYVSLDLPSRFAFYPFKELYAIPFKGKHLAKLSRAHEEGSTQHTVEAVNSVLRTNDGAVHLGYKLTVADFYYVLYWLRLNSYTKSVFVHESVCTNPKHHAMVASKEMLPDTLRQAEIINKVNLKTNFLEEIPNPEVFKLAYPGMKLKPATMMDAVALTEDPLFKAQDEEFTYSAQLAVYLQGPPMVDNHGVTIEMTLRDRIRVVDDMSVADIETIKEYEAALAGYGVVEQIQVTCKGCGASRTDKIHLEAQDFLPTGKAK